MYAFLAHFKQTISDITTNISYHFDNSYYFRDDLLQKIGFKYV